MIARSERENKGCSRSTVGAGRSPASAPAWSRRGAARRQNNLAFRQFRNSALIDVHVESDCFIQTNFAQGAECLVRDNHCRFQATGIFIAALPSVRPEETS
jgi:hypothetical protein